jgi:uncharacterized protein (DUF302 family)
MSAYEVTVTVRGTLEEVEARMVRALRAQGFGVLRGGRQSGGARDDRSSGNRDRYELLGTDPAHPRVAPCELLVGEESGLVTVSVHERESVGDVMDAGVAAKAGTLPPQARVRLRAALASLEGEP